MEPVTVRFNGALTVDQIEEQPDESLTAGEYLDAVAEAHGVPGDHGHEFVLLPDGEPVPESTPVAALAGETVLLRALRAPDGAEAAPDPTVEEAAPEVATAEPAPDVIEEPSTTAPTIEQGAAE